MFYNLGARIFCQGVQARWPENSLEKVFLKSSTYKLRFHRGCPMILLWRKLYFFQVSRGCQTFSRAGAGGQAFPGGTNANLIIHIICIRTFLY